MTEITETCADCKFFQVDEIELDDNGEYRRHAPVIMQNLKSTTGLFPTVFGYEWCGEFKPRLEVVQ